MEKGSKIDVLDYGYVILYDYMGSDQRVVEAARVSYAGESKGPEKDKKLLKYLWKNSHFSPFEQVQITLKIKLPIFVMRQLVRYRAAHLNEISGRYVEMKDEIHIPELWREQDLKNKQGSVKANNLDQDELTKKAEDHYKATYELYQEFIDKGVAREQARELLPLSLYTECLMTFDLRNLLNFIKQRDDSHAQYEIQVYAKAIRSILEELFPWTMEAFNEV